MRSFYVFLFILLAISSKAWSFDAPSGWESVFIPKVQEAWKNSEKPVYILITESKSEKEMSYEKMTEEQIIAGITGVRRSILVHFGIDVWQIYNLKKTEIAPGQWKLDYSGFFRNTNGKNVEFQEISYVHKKEIKLITLYDYSESGIENFTGVLDAYQPKFSKERVPTAALEASFCIDCDLDALAKEKPASIQIEKNTCEQQGGLIDPKHQSIFEKNNIKNYADGFWEQIGYNTMTCLWGLGDGIYTAAKDLVLLLPNLVDLVSSGAKTAKEKLWDAWDIEDAKKAFTWSNIKEKAGNLGKNIQSVAKVSWDKALEVLKASSENVKAAFDKNGKEGSFSTLAVEMFHYSPMGVMQMGMGKLWKLIEPSIEQEWGSFQCLSAESQSEVACKTISYITTSLVSGGAIVKGFSKAPKLLSYIRGLKDTYIRTQAVKKLSTAVEIAEDALPSLDPKKWSVVNTANVETIAAEVQQAKNGNYYLRTWKNEAYTYQQLDPQKQEKLIQSYQSLQNFKASSNPVEFLNSRFTRTAQDYARQMNETFDLKLANKKLKNLASRLENDPVFAKDYSDFLVKVQPYFAAGAETNASKMASSYLKNLHEFVLSSKEPIDLKRAAKIFTEAANQQDLARLEFWSNTWGQLAKADAKSPLNKVLPCFLKPRAVSLFSGGSTSASSSGNGNLCPF